MNKLLCEFYKLAFILMLAVNVICCSSADNSEDEYTYAPYEVTQKTLYMDVCYYSFQFTSNSSCICSLTEFGKAMNYSISGTPTCSYERTSFNSALFKARVPYHFKGFSGIIPPEDGVDTFELTLFFISPNEGYASGSNSLTTSGRWEDISFTLF